jgi:hypothetical protein
MKITETLNGVNVSLVKHPYKLKEPSDISYSLMNPRELRALNDFPDDIVDISDSSSARDVRSVKYLYSANGKLVEFEYSDKAKTISASIINNGNHLAIKSENLPKELKLINNPLVFHEALSAMHIRTAELSDGDIKLYAYVKGPGGVISYATEVAGHSDTKMYGIDYEELQEYWHQIASVRHDSLYFHNLITICIPCYAYLRLITTQGTVETAIIGIVNSSSRFSLHYASHDNYRGYCFSSIDGMFGGIYRSIEPGYCGGLICTKTAESVRTCSGYLSFRIKTLIGNYICVLGWQSNTGTVNRAGFEIRPPDNFMEQSSAAPNMDKLLLHNFAAVGKWHSIIMEQPLLGLKFELMFTNDAKADFRLHVSEL